MRIDQAACRGCVGADRIDFLYGHVGAKRAEALAPGRESHCLSTSDGPFRNTREAIAIHDGCILYNGPCGSACVGGKTAQSHGWIDRLEALKLTVGEPAQIDGGARGRQVEEIQAVYVVLEVFGGGPRLRQRLTL